MKERLENRSVYVLKYKGLNENMLYIQNFISFYVFFFSKSKDDFNVFCVKNYYF